MGRTRVLFIAASMRPGGAERVMASTLQRLDRGLYEPRLGLIEREGELLKELPSDLDVVEIGGGRARYALPGLIGEIRGFRPDVIFSTAGYVNVAVIVAAALMPGGAPPAIVRQTWTPSAILPRKRFPGLTARMYRWAYSRAHAVIAQSEAMKAEMIEHFGLDPDRVHVVYNPVPPPEAGPVGLESGGGGGGGPLFVTAGRITHQKGFDILIEAMGRVVREAPGARLVIYGKGAMGGELEALVARLGLGGSVRLAGYVDNPRRLYAGAEAFVFSSRFDAMPNALIEALAEGLPCVAADVAGGLREVAIDGLNGYVVPSGDAGALAGGMLRMIREGRATFDRAAISRAALERFGIEGAMMRYERIISSAAEALRE